MGAHTALEYAKRIAYSSEAVLMFTYEMAKKYANSPGVYCEAGVAAGAQVIAMAAGAPNKTIYAFDSFEGIPLPSNKDNQMPGIKFLSEAEQKALPNPGEQVLESSGATSVTEDHFWNHICNAFDTYTISLDMNPPIINAVGVNVNTVVGWFENTVPQWVDNMSGLNDKEIAILRLDGDLYNSTYVCLKYLYPKVIKGGLVVLDDIQLPGCRAACDDYFNSIGLTPDYKYVDNVAYFLK